MLRPPPGGAGRAGRRPGVGTARHAPGRRLAGHGPGLQPPGSRLRDPLPRGTTGPDLGLSAGRRHGRRRRPPGPRRLVCHQRPAVERPGLPAHHRHRRPPAHRHDPVSTARLSRLDGDTHGPATGRLLCARAVLPRPLRHDLRQPRRARVVAAHTPLHPRRLAAPRRRRCRGHRERRPVRRGAEPGQVQRVPPRWALRADLHDPRWDPDRPPRVADHAERRLRRRRACGATRRQPPPLWRAGARDRPRRPDRRGLAAGQAGVVVETRRATSGWPRRDGGSRGSCWPIPLT